MRVLVRLFKRQCGLWSLGRSPVPPKLVDMGVNEHLWNSTYDGVVAQNSQISKLLKEVKDEKQRLVSLGLQISTIFAILSLFYFEGNVDFIAWLFWYIVGTILLITLVLGHNPRQNAWFDAKKREGALIAHHWASFIHEQNDLYEPFGIKISAIRDKTSKKLIVGGLCMVQNVNSHNNRNSNDNGGLFNSHITMASNNHLVQNLESLDRLYQSGSLTQEEYTRAKDQVINDESTTTPLMAYAEAITMEDNAQVITEVLDDVLPGKGPDGSSGFIEIV